MMLEINPYAGVNSLAASVIIICIIALGLISIIVAQENRKRNSTKYPRAKIISLKKHKHQNHGNERSKKGYQ